ncbi:MAG TPA: hypothetical protein PLO61_07330 [Fimbriimonadaceae bacterium]|nr:hypothetical protein [Fimbriimonadaceae bacterium]
MGGLIACGGSSAPDAAAGLPIPSQPIPATYFGMHLHHAGHTRPWPDLSFGAYRSHDSFGTRWAQVQPERGRWDFTRLDQMILMSRARGIDVLVTLGHTPAWAAARPQDRSAYGPYMAGGPSEPAQIDDWRLYVRTLGQRYKGLVQTYEVWNEPDAPGFWTGSIEKLIEMTQIARYELKKIDPSITLVSPSPSGIGEAWFQKFLAAGGGRFVDVIGYHLYLPELAQPEEARATIERIRALLRQHNLQHLPLWNTESTVGRSPRTVYEGEKGAGILARALVLYWLNGVERFYWYSWDNRTHTGVPLVGEDMVTPNQAAQAYSRVYGWLVGATVIGARTEPGGTWVVGLKMASGQRAWLVWNPSGRLAFSIPRKWQARQVAPLLGDLRNLANPTQTTADELPKLLLAD